MNEMRLEPPENVPPPPPLPPPDPIEASPPSPRTGSIILGFVLGWLIVVIGYMSIVALHTISAFWLPEVAAVAVGIFFAVTGKLRTAAGIFIALGTMVALVLLLVAACFGMTSNGGFFH